MSLNDIKFIKGAGGLGRSLPTKDHYAGLLVYAGDMPDGFAADDIQKITSLKQAEALGITANAEDGMIKATHYHLMQFFAVYALNGVAPMLWVCFAPAPEADTLLDFNELRRMEETANGDIRKFGIFTKVTFTTALCDTLQTRLTELENVHYPASVILAANFADITQWGDTPDLRALKDGKVSVTIAQDGGHEGAKLYDTLKFSITNLGSLLAWATIKQVHENIGWVEKFNTAFNVEYTVPALANGDLILDVANDLDDLNTRGYIFLRKHTGTAGSYFNDSHTCVGADSDYAYMENNDTIDKAIRGIRAALLPKLNAPLQIDPDNGQIAITTVSHFESLAQKPLDQMKADGEISGGRVTIDPAQDVLATSELAITVELVINGVARNITVNIGFTKKLS